MGFHDTLEAGSQLDSYRIEAPVARSGMASIYRAVDTRNNRVVALKIPHPDLEADPILFDRFKREGRHRREAWTIRASCACSAAKSARAFTW